MEDSIRRATPVDAAALVQLRLDMYGELGWALDPLFADRTLAFFHKALLKESFVTLVKIVDGHIAATGSLTFFEVPPTAKQPLGYSSRLMNMYTAPAHRRKGYAEAILGELMQLAKNRCCERILLYSLPAGRGLYKKMGFEPLSDEWEIIFRD